MIQQKLPQVLNTWNILEIVQIRNFILKLFRKIFLLWKKTKLDIYKESDNENAPEINEVNDSQNNVVDSKIFLSL